MGYEQYTLKCSLLLNWTVCIPHKTTIKHLTIIAVRFCFWELQWPAFLEITRFRIVSYINGLTWLYVMTFLSRTRRDLCSTSLRWHNWLSWFTWNRSGDRRTEKIGPVLSVAGLYSSPWPRTIGGRYIITMHHLGLCPLNVAAWGFAPNLYDRRIPQQH